MPTRTVGHAHARQLHYRNRPIESARGACTARLPRGRRGPARLRTEGRRHTPQAKAAAEHDRSPGTAPSVASVSMKQRTMRCLQPCRYGYTRTQPILRRRVHHARVHPSRLPDFMLVSRSRHAGLSVSCIRWDDCSSCALWRLWPSVPYTGRVLNNPYANSHHGVRAAHSRAYVGKPDLTCGHAYVGKPDHSCGHAYMGKPDLTRGHTRMIFLFSAAFPALRTRRRWTWAT
jgi:hypothetical protein